LELTCKFLLSLALAAILACALLLTADAVPGGQRASGNDVGVVIENFGKVNDHLYHGAQPKGRYYEQLTALGIKTILNLRADARPQMNDGHNTTLENASKEVSKLRRTANE